MNVGIIIGRIGGWDGVALETEKWMEVLRSMGHNTFIISGQFQNRRVNSESDTLVPELSFFSPESVWSQKRAFFYPESDPAELIGHVTENSKVIYDKLMAWISERNIDMIISENASSLPSHLEMGLAIKDVIHQTGIPSLTHDHDFAWERGDRYRSSHRAIRNFIEGIFPLRAPNAVHAVINSHSAMLLKDQYGMDALNVPNVMDFDKAFGEPTPKNRKLPARMGYDDDDILLFQLTRILRRKRIETAIDLLDRLGDRKVKLIITGSYTDDAGSTYYNELLSLVHETNLSGQVCFASDLFHVTGKADDRGLDRFTLSDAYARARACTYFSTNEGFGNVIVEAILAKRPIFVNNYEPVYMPDIGSKGIRTVMIEHGNLSEEAVKSAAELIYNPHLASELAEYNYDLGRKYFSYRTLKEKLEELIHLAFKASGKVL